MVIRRFHPSAEARRLSTAHYFGKPTYKANDTRKIEGKIAKANQEPEG